MSASQHAEKSHGSDDHGVDHSPKYYIKIYFILLVLLIISILGPTLEIRVVTLITAFGIALVKATMVAAYFMHLNVEKRYIWYLLISMLLLIGIFFAGTSGDLMKVEGRNWHSKGASDLIKERAEHPASGEHHN